MSDYVKWFRHSTPYINTHRERTFVVLLPGEAIAHPNFNNIVNDIMLLNSLGVRLVLVHGSRPQIEDRLGARGLSSRYHQDLRITDRDRKSTRLNSSHVRISYAVFCLKKKKKKIKQNKSS